MKIKILMIEDEPLMASLLYRELQNAGFDAILARDGETGLEELEKGIPDIILLDLILPGINGFQILEKLKKDKSLKNIPVIILSNLGGKDDMEKGLKLGAEDYLIKTNILPSEIITKINETIAKKNKV